MNLRRLLTRATPIALVGVLLLAAPAQAYGPGQLLFTFADDRITESSGLAVSSTLNGVLFTHNDSGDAARFFAVDRRGATLATYTIPGPRPSDWEDMARGPDEAGTSSLFFGDIGGNFPRVDTVVTRVPEPTPDPSTLGVSTSTPDGVRFPLAYPDGPHDAEALFVHPVTGQLFVVTKAGLGPTTGVAAVYAAPQPLVADAANTLTRIGEVALTPTGTDPTFNVFGPAGELAVTGADMALDGSRIVVRTYTDAYEYAVPPGGTVADAFAPGRLAQRTALPVTRQGEGIAYTRDGRSLLVSSEKADQPAAPVHLLAGDGVSDPLGPDPAGPAPVIPEVPVAVLLPLAALGLLGVSMYRSGRVGRQFTRRWPGGRRPLHP